jgi:hypothetical protein
MTIDSKEVNTTRRRVEDAMTENRKECILIRRGQWENRRKRSKKLWRGQGDGKRKSKSKVENTEGKRLVEWIEENEWEVLNGNKEGDDIGSRGE